MSTIEIKIIKSLSKALSLCSQIDQNSDELVIDLTLTQFIDSNLTALVGAFIFYLQSKNIAVKIILPQDNKVYTTLCKNNFLPFFASQCKKMNDITKTVIEFQQFDIHDTIKQDNFYELLHNGLLKARGLNNLSDRVLKEITKSVIELFSNAISHSMSQCGIFCAGQYFSKYNKLDITIVDIGVGIPHKVRTYIGKKINDDEAIYWAMQRQNTTREDIGGLGLHLLKRLIIMTKGKLEIVSYNGYYSIVNSKEKLGIKDFCFPGTIINIEFKIDNNFYVFKDEINED